MSSSSRRGAAARREHRRSRLEESQCVSESHAATDLRSKVFDEREMVAIQAIANVERGHRDYLRVVLLSDRVRSVRVEHGIARRSGLGREEPVLIPRNDRFRSEPEALVRSFEADTASQRRYPGNRRIALCQGRVDIVKRRDKPEAGMQ